MNNKTYIIAEAGVNHNGSLDLACQLIDAAVAAHANAVKFQIFKADKLVSKTAQKAEYQQKNDPGSESQYEMLKRLELSHQDHRYLQEYCRARAIDFLSTAFDHPSLEFLVNEIKLERLKIPSGELTNAPLLLAHANSKRDLIVSTGMANLVEIEAALGVLAYGLLGGDSPGRDNFVKAYQSEQGRAILRKKVTLLHCTTEYPAPMADINLKAMDTMREYFGLSVGYSDHSAGIIVPIAAVARGAIIIEKHFTLDKQLPGPDHQASLNPDELNEMIVQIRQIELALGDGIKQSRVSEIKNMPIARKSLIARRAIQKGEKLTQENMAVMRPGGGLSPYKYWEMLGQASVVALTEGDYINE